MDLKEITLRLSAIAALTQDPEAAHSRQDQLYEDVLLAIAEGASDAAELASHTLAVREIDFPRWMA